MTRIPSKFVRLTVYYFLMVHLELVLAGSPINPDPIKTPGDVLTTDPDVICVSGYTKQVRHVMKATKDQVYDAYGIDHRYPGQYEVDHLISLELGGSNDIKNLWPESFITQPLNAHVKDRLENTLHKLICTHQLSVQQAQQEIATNWIEAYEKYIGPLPKVEAQVDEGDQLSRIDAHETPGDPDPNRVSDDISPDDQSQCPAVSPIKVSRRGIYHVVTDSNYRATKAVQCFKTVESAEQAGYRAPHK